MRTEIVSMKEKQPGFTLIELLIVVAIIGILAAIAVPNFMNAQVRAKVARCQADMKSLSTALESYRVDNNMYPPTPNTAGNLRFARLSRLTSPVSYMTSVPLDPFRQGIDVTNSALFQAEDSAYPLWDPDYANPRRQDGNTFQWIPDQNRRTGGYVLHGAMPDTDYEAAEGMPLHIYDSSNGLKSSGDYYRFGS
jgi:type II secretion system protein G